MYPGARGTGGLPCAAGGPSCVFLLAGFLLFVARSTRMSPELHRNSREITGLSPEFRQTIELEHLRKGGMTTTRPSHARAPALRKFGRRGGPAAGWRYTDPTTIIIIIIRRRRRRIRIIIIIIVIIIVIIIIIMVIVVVLIIIVIVIVIVIVMVMVIVIVIVIIIIMGQAQLQAANGATLRVQQERQLRKLGKTDYCDCYIIIATTITITITITKYWYYDYHHCYYHYD